MIKEAIILAGGLGTRLRSVVPDVPKCLAPVAGKPFLYYVIAHLRKEGIRNFIFSVGYKNEAIIAFVNRELLSLGRQGLINFQFSIEEQPLGTGGAIKLSGEKVSDHDIIVCNVYAYSLIIFNKFPAVTFVTCTVTVFKYFDIAVTHRV